MSVGGWSVPVFATIAAVLRERAGLEFPLNRQSFAEAGIRRAMAKFMIDSPAAYLAHLQSGSASIEDLAEEVGVGETYFFRDPVQFATIRTRLLPDLVARRGPMPAPRIWSAGCATGEEAYSLAILLEEERLAVGARIYGTDVSEAALSAARRGVFSSWSLRGDLALIAPRYFRRRGDRFVLNEDLRGRVAFSRLNLATGDPFPEVWSGGLDIILCRNVLIYFSSDAVQRVGHRLLQSLAPEGWLITGPSDPLLQVAHPFEAVLTPGGIFYRRTTAARTVTRASTSLPRSRWKKPMPGVEDGPQHTHRAAKPAIAEVPVSIGDSAAAVTRVRQLGDTGAIKEAAGVAAEESATHPLCAELHFLHGMLLMEQGSHRAAADAMRRVLYLDPGLAVAQLSLGSILQRLGSKVEAWSAYQRGHDIAALQPPDRVMPLSDGAPAEHLVRAAKSRMAALAADWAYSS